eukprot:Phypoly_transcript_02548.p1 GENE.Phypoly_transcript_02548~~Phypoly_transcript_02548.p1  ORF type:complete len:851 (+),score=270.87 Phypoly_transcript_02548:43-2595(+)
MSASARSFYPPTNGISRVKALFDYEGPDGSYDGNYLKFKTGDFIDVIEKCETGWWRGTIRNNEGLFPPTYCEELTPRRVLNVDTKKASPTIKRMQHLLKLTVTSTGEKVEEIQKEMSDEERWFTRERAKSFLSSGKSKKGSDEKEGKEEARLTEPGAKEKPSQNAELINLNKRISELEAEKMDMMEEFTLSRARLLEEFATVQAKQQEEFSQKISLLNEMLDEKSLVIEIMKKDLEIKEEENKHVTIELELEIEKLIQNCVELESRVGHLVPLPEENEDPLEPAEIRLEVPTEPTEIPTEPTEIPTEPTKIPTESTTNIPEEPSAQHSEEVHSTENSEKTPEDTSAKIASEDNSAKNPVEASSENAPVNTDTPSTNTPALPAELSDPEQSNQVPPTNTTPDPTPATPSHDSAAASTPTHDPAPSHTTPSHDSAAPSTPTHDFAVPSIPAHSPTAPSTPHDSSSAATPFHDPPNSITPRHQRFKTFHSLTNLTALTSPATPTTPTSMIASMNSRKAPVRPRRTPSMLYSPTLLPPTPNSGRTKIPNLDVSLAKLAELGPHPSARAHEQSADAPDPVVEISELKKRIAELETERLRMIEEYRSKIDKEKEKAQNAPPSPSLPPPSPSTSTSLSATSPSPSPLLQSSSAPPSIPPLALGSMKGRLPPPVPPPPSEAFASLYEKKDDLFAKLDEFEFLFRKTDANAQSDLKPDEKVGKILDAVRTTMPRYFYFVVLAIKYDAIQSGKKRFCNLDASELYEEALARHLYHGDWPVFVRDKLAPSPGITLSSSSLLVPPSFLLSSGSSLRPPASPSSLALSSSSFQVIPPPSPSTPKTPTTPSSLMDAFRSIFKKQ